MSSATPEYSVGKTVLLILGLSFIQFVIPLVFNFMDIDAKYYQVYIYWCMALVIFYIALPSVVGEYIFLLPAAKAAAQTAAQTAAPAKPSGKAKKTRIKGAAPSSKAVPSPPTKPPGDGS
tara:strand:+ start:542 stop:901 length:360 start_codon:yes stop_codon:yes gene_type:complete